MAGGPARSVPRASLTPFVAAIVLLLQPASAHLVAELEPITSPEVAPSLDFRSDAALAASAWLDDGSGTADDPFVFADLAIIHAGASGVRLEGTRAHVVFRNVYIPGYTAVGAAECNDTTDCGASAGVLLRNVTNVSFEDLRVITAAYGVRIDGATDVRIERATLGDGASPRAGVGVGIELDGARRATVRETHIVNTTRPMRVLASEDVDVERVVVDVAGGTLPIADIHNVTFRDSMFRNTQLLGSRAVNDLTLRGNELRGASFVMSGPNATLARALFCGNLFEDAGTAIFLRSASGIAIVGNHFARSRSADVQFSTNVRFDGNLVAGSADFDLVLAGSGLTAQNNSFSGQRVGIFESGADVRHNWWRDATGPAGVGPGSGTALVTNGRQVQYDPWLAAEPPTPLACPPTPGDAGTPRVVLWGLPSGPVPLP